MRDEERSAPQEHSDSPSLTPEERADTAEEKSLPHGDFDESLFKEIGGLIDSTRNYAEAELNYQKTRVELAGRKFGVLLITAVLSIILLNAAVIALIVGLILALEPSVGIWGAMGIVIGTLLIGVAALVWKGHHSIQVIVRVARHFPGWHD